MAPRLCVAHFRPKYNCTKPLSRPLSICHHRQCVKHSRRCIKHVAAVPRQFCPRARDNSWVGIGPSGNVANARDLPHSENLRVHVPCIFLKIIDLDSRGMAEFHPHRCSIIGEHLSRRFSILAISWSATVSAPSATDLHPCQQGIKRTLY